MNSFYLLFIFFNFFCLVETLKLTAFGKDIKLFNSLLEESRQKAVKDLG
jgi:hypothetical protein